MNTLRAASVVLVSFLAGATACSNTTDPVSSADDNLDTASSCACALSDVCTSGGRCVARPAQDGSQVFANFELLQQVSLHATDALADLAEASASLNAGDPLPADTRPSWKTDANENCFFEVDTNYPSSYGNGQFWPTTPGLDAGGKITFDVAGGRGPIELDAVNGSTPPDWAYLHGSTPAPLEEDDTIFADFFGAAYVPAGKAVSVKIAGGPDVAAHTVKGVLPNAFAITAPAVEGDNATAPLGEDLNVTWSPAQPSALMEIFLTMDMGADVALVSCKVKDDGAVVIPKAALGTFIGQIDVQLRRTTERLTQVRQADGKIIQASVLGRNARLGTFTLTSR